MITGYYTKGYSFAVEHYKSDWIMRGITANDCEIDSSHEAYPRIIEWAERNKAKFKALNA